MSDLSSNPQLQATSYDLLWTVLVTVGSILFGFSWCVAYYIMHNKQIREAVIGNCLTSFTQIVLTNPSVLSIVTGVRSWFSNDQRPTCQEASLSNRDTVMSIPFSFQSQQFTFLVPYSRAGARREAERFSIAENGHRQHLGHCPGVPFVITAEQLGCVRIEKLDDEF